MRRIGLLFVVFVLLAPAQADAAPRHRAKVKVGAQRVRIIVDAGVKWRLVVRRRGTVVRRAHGVGRGRIRVRGCRRVVVVLRVRAPRAARRERAGGPRRVRAVRRRSCAPPSRGDYRVGAATRDIAPRPQDGDVFLGGYGIGGGRKSAGLFRDGLEARAIAISGGGRTLVLADVELQGWFIANGNDKLAINDVRRAVAARHGLDPSSVIVQTNHTHSGPDLLGAWGGASAAYRQRVFDQTVGVIDDALAARAPASLVYGVTDGRDLLSNQFDYDPPNQSVDSEVRVLQARDPRGTPLVTLLNFSAHATVLGGDNLLASGDWTTRANALLENRIGGRAVTLMGTLGRTQPQDERCANADDDGCAVDAYATRVVRRAEQAIKAAQPLSGPPAVDARSYLIQDLSENPAVLGLNYAGSLLGAQLVRSTSAPWLTANALGTTTTTARIGDVLLLAMPGEAYPQIPLAVRDLVPGMRGYMTMGLANDQLGYLIAPVAAYPEPIRRTLFNQRGDELSPIDNDNYFFNVSLTIGERVTCSLLRGVGDVLGTGDAARSAHEPCALFADDLTRPAGADLGQVSVRCRTSACVGSASARR